MGTFAVCSRFVEGAPGGSGYYALNVLFKIVQDNNLKIALDEAGTALESYKNAARSQLIRQWLRSLSKNFDRHVDIVEVLKTNSIEETFVEIAAAPEANSQLIVWSASHYNDIEHLVKGRGVRLVNREQSVKAVENATKKENTVGHNINVSGNNSIVIVDAELSNSINDNQFDTNTVQEALALIAQKIEKEGSVSKGARDAFKALADEVAKGDDVDGSVLQQCWENLVKIAPGIASISKAVAVITSLFSGS